MLDEDFLNRKEIKIYKRIIISLVILAILFMIGVIVLALQ